MGKCGPLKGVNLHRILEFAFRNISLNKHCLAYSTDSGINKLPKGILRLAVALSVAESSERRSLLWRKYDRCNMHFFGHQVLILFWTHLPCFFSILSVCMPGLFCSAAFWLVRIAYCGRLGRGAEKNRAIKRFRNRAISNRDFISISINRTALILTNLQKTPQTGHCFQQRCLWLATILNTAKARCK